MNVDQLPGGGGDAIKFDSVGAVISGRVLNLKSVSTKDMKTGSPVDVPVINLEVDGAERSLWVNKAALGDAIKKAARAAGIGNLEGCTLTIKREADKPSSTAGFSPAHQFKAKVEKAVDDDQSDPF